MAKFTIIGDVSVELRRQIYAALGSTSEVDFNLQNISQDILIGPPDRDATNGAPIAALYLYHVLPSRHLRNQRLLPDPNDADRFRTPPLPLELRYLLTPLTDDEIGHALIGRVLQHFHDNASFDTIGGVPIGDSFGGAPNALRVTADPLTVEQLTQLWGAFSSPYRLSIGLLVEVVPIDSALPVRRTPRVGEKVVVTGIMQ